MGGPHPGLALAPQVLPQEPQPRNNNNSWHLWGTYYKSAWHLLVCFAQMISLNPQIPLKQP